MHPSQPEFSYISILPSFCPSFGFTPWVECWGMAATIGMIVPDLFGRFEGYLSPSMSLAGRSTMEGTLICFVSRTSSIINHQSSSHTKKMDGFVAKKTTLDRAKEPRVFRCAMHHWGQDSVFFQMTSEKCIKSADCISGSNQFISIWSILFVCFYSFYRSELQVFFNIGRGSKNISDCPWLSLWFRSWTFSMESPTTARGHLSAQGCNFWCDPCWSLPRPMTNLSVNKNTAI